MKKFEFSLSAVLKVRIRKEEIAQNDLWEAHQLLKRVTLELNSLIDESRNIDDQIRKAQQEMYRIEGLVKLFEYLGVVKKKIKLQEEVVKEAKFGVEIRRKMAVKAMQERKVIENIKEKKFKDWEKEFLDQERKAFDEIATMQFESEVLKTFHSQHNKNNSTPERGAGMH